MGNSIMGTPAQALPSADLNLGGTSTSEAIFVTPATKSGTNPTASQAIMLWFPSDGQIAGIAPSSSYSGVLPPAYNGAFGSGFLSAQGPSQRFRVVAWGRVTTGTTANFTAILYWSTSLSRTGVGPGVPASGGRIATTGAVSLATISSNWFIEAVLLYDASSLKMNGYYSAQLVGTTVAPTTITNIQTAIDSTTAGQTLGFVVTGTFSSGNAANKAFLDGFILILD